VVAHHVGKEECAQIDDGLDVGADHGQLRLPIAPVDGAHGGKAGVVDEDVDRQSSSPDLLTEREA
jgi:hypothetical protein